MFFGYLFLLLARPVLRRRQRGVAQEVETFGLHQALHPAGFGARAQQLQRQRVEVQGHGAGRAQRAAGEDLQAGAAAEGQDVRPRDAGPVGFPGGLARQPLREVLPAGPGDHAVLVLAGRVHRRLPEGQLQGRRGGAALDLHLAVAVVVVVVVVAAAAAAVVVAVVVAVVAAVVALVVVLAGSTGNHLRWY